VPSVRLHTGSSVSVIGLGRGVAAPLPGQPARPMEDRPNAADPLLRESRVLQLPEVLLHVEWRKRCDPTATDRLLDMQRPHRLVVGGGVGREIGPAVRPPRRDGVVDRRRRSPVRATGRGSRPASSPARSPGGRASRSAARRLPRNRRWRWRTRPSLSRPTYWLS
jgi:hypothetical protein